MWLLKYALELLGFACRTLQYVSWLLQPLLQESKGHQLLHNLSNIPNTPVFLGRPDCLKSSQPQIPGLHLELQVEGVTLRVTPHQNSDPHFSRTRTCSKISYRVSHPPTNLSSVFGTPRTRPCPTLPILYPFPATLTEAL